MFKQTGCYLLGLLQYQTQGVHKPSATVFGASKSGAAAQHGLVSPPLEQTKHLTGKRWLRDGGETCVHQIWKSEKLFTDYVVSYKFHDPAWSPLLRLPCGVPAGLEAKSRHISAGLRHLVQGDHAAYAIRHTGHSVVHPGAVAERAHVACRLFSAPGLAPADPRLPGLQVHIAHEGRVGRGRAVVAASVVEGLALDFERREQLWKRSRRVGAMAAEMAAYDWTLAHPRDVGRAAHPQVFLLGPHLRHLNGATAAVGIVSSHHIALHPYLYTHSFEVPSPAVIDTVQQLVFQNARRNELVAPGEELCWVAWTTESRFPFPPVESDMQFFLQSSTPQVHHDDTIDRGIVGSPYISNVPLQYRMFDVSLGKPDYIYDEGSVYRP